MQERILDQHGVSAMDAGDEWTSRTDAGNEEGMAPYDPFWKRFGLVLSVLTAVNLLVMVINCYAIRWTNRKRYKNKRRAEAAEEAFESEAETNKSESDSQIIHLTPELAPRNKPIVVAGLAPETGDKKLLPIVQKAKKKKEERETLEKSEDNKVVKDKKMKKITDPPPKSKVEAEESKAGKGAEEKEKARKAEAATEQVKEDGARAKDASVRMNAEETKVKKPPADAHQAKLRRRTVRIKSPSPSTTSSSGGDEFRASKRKSSAMKAIQQIPHPMETRSQTRQKRPPPKSARVKTAASSSEGKIQGDRAQMSKVRQRKKATQKKGSESGEEAFYADFEKDFW